MLADARTLVTGAAGFLGANLVRRLLDSGADVVALLKPGTDAWRLRDVEPRITLRRADVRTLPDLGDLGRIDYVFHLATAAVDQSVRDAKAMLETNVLGTHAVLVAAERLQVKRLVHIGSSGEYGPASCAVEDQALAPNAEYGATKAAASLLVQAFARRTGLSTVILRPFSVFGPFEAPYRLVPYCILRGLDGRPIEVTDGRQTRDYVYVDDAMRALLMAAAHPEAGGGVFNVCTGASTAVRAMVELIAARTGTPRPPAFGARPHAGTEMWTTSGSPERAARVLGWHAETPLEEAVDRSIAWLRSARAAYPDVYGR